MPQDDTRMSSSEGLSLGGHKSGSALPLLQPLRVIMTFILARLRDGVSGVAFTARISELSFFLLVHAANTSAIERPRLTLKS